MELQATRYRYKSAFGMFRIELRPGIEGWQLVWGQIHLGTHASSEAALAHLLHGRALPSVFGGVAPPDVPGALDGWAVRRPKAPVVKAPSTRRRTAGW